MRRLAILFALLATAHVAETVMTPERVDAFRGVASRVFRVVRTAWNGWRREIWERPFRRLSAG